MNDTSTFASTDEARAFRANHDLAAHMLSKQSKSALVSQANGKGIWANAKWSKDELIAALADYLFPRDRMEEANHVLYHKPGENWSACEWCK